MFNFIFSFENLKGEGVDHETYCYSMHKDMGRTEYTISYEHSVGNMVVPKPCFM